MKKNQISKISRENKLIPRTSIIVIMTSNGCHNDVVSKGTGLKSHVEKELISKYEI